MTPGQLAALHAAAFTSTRPWSAAEFASLLAQPGTLLATTPHAFALGRITLDEAEVLAVACDPAHQRQGEAQRALTALHEKARGRGAVTSFLEVAEDNGAALALYARAGYLQTGKRPGYYRTKDGHFIAALIFAKALTAP